MLDTFERVSEQTWLARLLARRKWSDRSDF
jgi:hypothetical protein